MFFLTPDLCATILLLCMGLCVIIHMGEIKRELKNLAHQPIEIYVKELVALPPDLQGTDVGYEQFKQAAWNETYSEGEEEPPLNSNKF